MTKLRERAGDGTWLGDLGELVELFYHEDRIAPWVKYSALFLSAAAALVVAVLLWINGNNPNGTPEPQENPSASASVNPEPTPSPSASEEPSVPFVLDELITKVPGAWKPASLPGCTQSWESATQGISSVAVLSSSKEAFAVSGFTSRSAWGENSLTVEGAGNQNGVTSVELYFDTNSMNICAN